MYQNKDYKNQNNGNREQREKVLPENKSQAISDLLNTPQYENKAADEQQYLLLYLNFAVANIQKIAQFDTTDEKKVWAEIEKKNDSVIQELADFLWLFNVDDPSCDFKDYKEKTIILTEKIFALRNFFAHPGQGSISPLLADREFYVFLEGILLDLARVSAQKKGLPTEKLYKLKLMNKHMDPKSPVFQKSKQYELTRKGIIFLTCMGLYKDEAQEFCQLFVDMKLPQRCPGSTGDFCSETACPAKAEKTCNFSKAKALQTMFTAFSYRRGRTDLNAEDLDFMSFADIITCLNKVPPQALDYLELKAEHDLLDAEKNASEEILENKEYKYKLHPRAKNRFLQFAAAYCEDFNILSCLRFKRLDISKTAGRKKYCFGSENDNRNRMNRHYVIKEDAIHFEFIPEMHYGEIKIKALRSSIHESEFKRMLLLCLKDGGAAVNKQLYSYFSKYHFILEKMLNSKDESFDLEDDMASAFASVANVEKDSLYTEEFTAILKPFFSENLTRFFIGDENAMSEKKMILEIYNKYAVMQNHAIDFQERVTTFSKWKRLPEEKRKTVRPPVCKDVQNPPFSSKIGDAEMISWVFKALNLHLSPDEKFRQLPLGEQHNDGTKDHEYQLIHAAIGKYSLDQEGFASLIKKIRSKLEPITSELNKRVMTLLREENKYLLNHPRYDRNGRPVKASPTLAMLAMAAAEHYIDFCDKKLTEWDAVTVGSTHKETLRAECRKLGIKTGMPLNREALIKTILKIDLDRWTHAYDYENGRPWENRTLENTEHIVSQIPFPKNFAARCVKKNSEFDFNREFQNLKLKIKLRDYYDVSPLIAMINGEDHPGVRRERQFLYHDKLVSEPLNLSKTALDKVSKQLKNVHNQDKLLSLMAYEYFSRFMKQEESSFGRAKLADDLSVKGYFDTQFSLPVKGAELTIKFQANDMLRPAFSLLRTKEYCIAAAKQIDPELNTKEFDFYRLQDALRIVQANDRVKRFQFLKEISRFESRVILPQYLAYSSNPNKKEREEENRKIEFPHYKQAYRTLTMDDFNCLVEARNAVYHTGIDLNISQAMSILNRLLSVPGRR